MRGRSILLPAAFLASAPIPAQQPVPLVQTPLEALAQDGGEYAKRYGVTLAEAIARLEWQEASVAAVDALREEFRDRLAGVSIEHRPAYRVVVLLSGDEPVADRSIAAGPLTVPVVFRTGAKSTRAQLLEAIERHQADLRGALLRPPGMGVDERNGTLAVMVSAIDANPMLEARLAAVARAPVTVTSWGDVTTSDMSVEGGGRVVGVDPADGRRHYCTTGFAVTDGARTAIATAAHCPDMLAYREGPGSEVPLSYVDAWGARTQDVQIHLAPQPLEPLFHPDAAQAISRPLASWRNRASSRVGDFVCHRGERTGYSCAEIAYVDYAPPGDLCAGPCPATWVAVEGPGCGGGDSGGPVFLGQVAFGLMKGGSYSPARSCRLYYYMSIDYLPTGWTLLHR